MGRRSGARTCRDEVEDGSKPEREGVISAFRFWIILSSMVLRESRRKSGPGLGFSEGFWALWRWEMLGRYTA